MVPQGLVRRVERKIGTDYSQYLVTVDDGDSNTSWVDQVRNGLLDDNAEQLTVTEAMRRVGYQSESSFSKAFQRCLGWSPAAYRRSFRQSSNLSAG